MKYMHLIEYQDIQNWENYDTEASYDQNTNNYINYLNRSLGHVAIITIKGEYGSAGKNYYYKPAIK